jgi:ParB-like chromosome segregation protein Spo0J
VQVEIVPVNSLTLNPDNVNMHTDEHIEQLAVSLMEFGQQSPLVVQHDGIVLRGNGLLKAARQLGMTGIAIVRSDLVGSHAAGFAVADNRLGEKSQRDIAKLLGVLEALVDDVSLEALGFNHEQIDVLIEKVEGVVSTVDRSKAVETKLAAEAPQQMAWVLLKVPVKEYGAVGATIRSMAGIPGVICESALSAASGAANIV